MKVLFVGGTGLISTAVSKQAVKRGIDLYVLNRGHNNHVLPKQVTTLTADINDKDAVRRVLAGHRFDSIVEWIAFTPEHVKRDVELFQGITDQYVFISSASAYQKPLPTLPITEDVPLDNSYWEYSRNKQRCEEYLNEVNGPDFPVTIIRPSHTYNDHSLVGQLKSWAHPYTILHRIANDQPVILGDQGMQLWTLTYNADFAAGFLDVLGNPATYGETYHLTSDKAYTWERIHELMCDAMGKKPNVIYIPWDVIFEHFPEFKPEILGDKYKSAIFDNSKIKAVAPHYTSQTEYGTIVKKAVKHYRKHKQLQTVDEEFLRRYDALIDAYRSTSS